MAVRSIRVFGDPVLRANCLPVTEFDNDLCRLVGDLSDTLADANGAGLAAPQVGVSLRVFVYVVTDPEMPEFRTTHHIVNPVLTERSDELVTDVEGCLSIPGLSYELARSRRVVAQGFDMHGEPLQVEGTERLARCLAHETDHLDGVLFVDQLEPEEHERAMAEIREMLQAGENVRVKPSPHVGTY